MNTMYRNNIGDKRDDKTGYQKVQDAIVSERDKILRSDDFIVRNNSLDMLNMTDEEKDVAKELYGIAKSIPYGPWSQDMKSKIEGNLSKLKAVPKALLHVHSTVGLSVDNLWDLIRQWNVDQKKLEEKTAKEEKYIDLKIYYVNVEIPHHPGVIQNILMYGPQVEKLENPKDPKDPEKGWILKESGLVDDQWLADNKTNFYMLKEGEIDTSWEEFGILFMRTNHLFQDRNFYKQYHTRLFEECLEDNISYVELRTGFADFADWENNEETQNSIIFLRSDFRIRDCIYHTEPMNILDPIAPNAEFLELILEARDEAVKNWSKPSEPSEPSELSKTLEVKVILTANRNKTMRDMKDTCDKIDAAISMKNGFVSVKKREPQEIADMVVGFDFVNREEKTWGLTDELHGIVYGEFLGATQTTDNKLRKLKEKRRIELILFFFHDGESTEIINDRGSNAITGPICSRHRIGHGFQMGTAENLDEGNLLYGKDIMQYILNGHKSDIGVQGNYPIKEGTGGDKYTRWDYIIEPVIELCPISNYMLGYVNDLKEHPAISLMENGILAVICNDDPQLFESKGLSYDYAMMYISLKKYFEGKYKDKPDKMEQMVMTSAYKYLKLSSFLGYFYKEMSSAYYTNENDIIVVNDNLTIQGNNDEKSEKVVFEVALEKFREAWNEFIKPSAEHNLPALEIVS